MFVLAVTGGIGAGKSEAARRFAEHGAVVLDADAMARALVLHDPAIRERLIAAFGPGVLISGDAVSTTALAEAAFASDDAVRQLNAIVHPAVVRELTEGLRSLQLLERPPRVAVIDVPLLAEAPAIAELADRVLAIEAPEGTRVARCVERGMSERDCRDRMARQAPDEERRQIADSVLVNDGSLEAFHGALDGFWHREVAPDGA